jgi:hypothetical protein
MTERLEESLVDGIETFRFSGGSETSCEHELISGNAFNGVGFVEREFIFC